MKKKDITGEKFGRLTVLDLSPIRNTPKKRYWNVRCDCGNKFIATACNIRKAKAGCNDCGNKLIAKKRTIHGMGETRFYNIWNGLNSRCNNLNYAEAKYYSERGIKCLWKSFVEFKNDMYKSYLDHVSKFGEKQTTIDRVDNDGNYCKDNCRWATCKEQNDNKRVANGYSLNNK